MLGFFVEDEVRKLRNVGHWDAKVLLKTDVLANFVREEGCKVLKSHEEEEVVTTENFWGEHPETEGENMHALECVFSELGLEDTKVQMNERIEVDQGSWRRDGNHEEGGMDIEQGTASLRLNGELYPDP
jgi:hypothetical protein